MAEFAQERLLRIFWGRWLRIWSQYLKVQNGGSSMAVEYMIFWWTLAHRCSHKMPWMQLLLSDKSYQKIPRSNQRLENNWYAPAAQPMNNQTEQTEWRIMSNVNKRTGLNSVICWLSNSATTLFDSCCRNDGCLSYESNRCPFVVL